MRLPTSHIGQCRFMFGGMILAAIVYMLIATSLFSTFAGFVGIAYFAGAWVMAEIMERHDDS